MIERAVTLRSWRKEDAAWYVAQLSDPEILQFTTESAATSTDHFLDALTKLAVTPGQAGFAIVRPDTGDLAGNIAAVLDEIDHTAAEISYWVAAEARGRGLATRAVRELCSWTRENWPAVREVTLWTHADNIASQRVALAAGFHRQPSRDGYRTVAGQRWPVRWYALQLR